MNNLDLRIQTHSVQRVPLGILRPPPDEWLVRQVDEDHIQRLIYAVDLPPIVVHKGTNRIVDGVHRWSAALRRGDASIEAQFVSGQNIALLALAVRQNVSHGLPLASAEKRRVAGKMLRANPSASDRSLARHLAMSPTTIANIRKSLQEELPLDTSRTGADGRTRRRTSQSDNFAHANNIEARQIRKRTASLMQRVLQETREVAELSRSDLVDAVDDEIAVELAELWSQISKNATVSSHKI